MATIQSTVVIVANSEADRVRCQEFLDSMHHNVGRNAGVGTTRADDGLTITITFDKESVWDIPDM